MKTKVFDHTVGEAPEILQNGGLVAVPTETVYGLAGNGLDAEAVEKIYAVKGRPAIKPLSLMVSGTEAIDAYALDVPPAAYTLAEAFWPGPLTIVLRAKEIIPSIVLAGGHTVGLRCPDHPLTLQALRMSGIPFAAPSANLSGGISPKTAEDVLRVFDGVIDGVIDGGECTLGRESTLLDMSTLPYRILRQGALPEEKIADALAGDMTIIGITGMTGAGKSSVLEAFSEYGALLIDCDSVYHELLDSSKELLDALKARFPAAFSGGTLDRKALGRIVFADESELSALNAITHAHVLREVLSRLRRFAMEGGRVAAVDAVELISSGLSARCSFTIAVVAPEEVRLSRIMERDGISREYALSRIRAQKDEAYYRENCTFTIVNDGSPEQLKNAVGEILKSKLKTE